MISSILLYVFWPIMDTIMLVDVLVAWLYPGMFDAYDIIQIEDEFSDDLSKLWNVPNKLIFYPIGITTQYFIDIRRACEYMVKYFLTRINMYPDSYWFTNPQKHMIPGD